MKKLSIIAIIVLMTASAVSAHEGSLGLFTSEAATDCDATLPPFTPFDVYIMYLRSDGGPDGITGAEFRAELSVPATEVAILSPTWNPALLTNGDVTTGIGVVFQSECYGPGESMIWIGTLQLMSMGAPAGWDMRILGDPRSTSPPGLNVSICDTEKSMQPILGGWFIGEEGRCNVGSESTTWGAVKSLYNQ